MAHENFFHSISSKHCAHCGGPAPDWKCPACGAESTVFDPSHWRTCTKGAKMQALCKACDKAESLCTCSRAVGV
jgi:hypothetical protein